VAHYLLDAAGLTDVTPQAFSNAIEAETDVPVAAQDEVNQLIDDEEVQVLINNPQTETPVTEQVVERANNAGIPVVDLTETLPDGVDDYLEWISEGVDALHAAVAQ
jgi:zinc/manganese transport system substrate-binding protein